MSLHSKKRRHNFPQNTLILLFTVYNKRGAYSGFMARKQDLCVSAVKVNRGFQPNEAQIKKKEKYANFTMQRENSGTSVGDN